MVGAASVNPYSLAIVLSFLFGASLGSTLLVLADGSINVRTKVAIVLLLILQGWLGVKWYRSTFKSSYFDPFEPGSHVSDQSSGRFVSDPEMLDALKNPLKITDVKYDNLGRPSQQYIGKDATVAVNPATKQMITAWRTSSKLASKLTK